MWTGQRIEKFYDILVKDVLSNGDIEKVDTKENRQRCRQIHYDFKGSSIYSRGKYFSKSQNFGGGIVLKFEIFWKSFEKS